MSHRPIFNIHSILFNAYIRTTTIYAVLKKERVVSAFAAIAKEGVALHWPISRADPVGRKRRYLFVLISIFKMGARSSQRLANIGGALHAQTAI
jgi:hypothetical protein